MTTFAQNTGNMVNHLYARMTKGQPEPTVGMGATLLGGRDRHAGTIIEVFTKGKFTYVKVQQDKATRTDSNGMSESQTYSFEPDPTGPVTTYRFRNQMWECVYLTEAGRYKVEKYSGLRIGERSEFYDFSF